MKTMHEEYEEPNDKLGKHIVCEKCGSCKTCSDCEKHGCGASSSQEGSK